MKSDPVPELLAKATERLLQQFSHLPETPPHATESLAAIQAVLDRTAARLGNNYPYFHPLYAGQMLKPPHPVARAAYALAMLVNPNNHARDGGRASSEMEIEAVREIAAMFGWSDRYLGHLTSSGTIANLEALWVAGRCSEGKGTRDKGERAGAPKRILASDQAHYTHSRISGVLRLEFASVRTDNRGRMDLVALEDELRKGDVGTVVATLGTTAIGAVDPLPEILELRKKYGFRVHVDAAYGGYFKLIPEALDEPARRAYAAIAEADSIVVDPHKHGLQPYGCGCVLFRDPGVGRFYKHDSPYTYFTSKELHLGEISLECSRAGAAAVALWATQQLLPLVRGGEFARGLAAGRRAAQELDRRIRQDSRFAALVAGTPELDIVVWAAKGQGTANCHPARVPPVPRFRGPGSQVNQPPAESLSSDWAQAIFDACAKRDLHLALVQLPRQWFQSSAPTGELVTCLRSVLMKAEHEEWLGEIWRRIDEAACD
jgi:tyrosine decarboxylase / aspartate 1-decarboxylase